MNDKKIDKKTLEFLSELKDNNYREWFQANKSRYEEARDNVLAFSERLRERISAFDPEVSLGYPIKKVMFRIYRDTRFSRDKSPYKRHIGVNINDNGILKSPFAGYYLSIEPGECLIASGCYAPEKRELGLLRDAFDLDWELFEEEVLGNKEFASLIGGLSHEERMLKRVPMGYPKDSPAAEYLKLTSFYGYALMSDKIVMSDSALDEAEKLCRAMLPLKKFINRALSYSEDE